MCFSTFIYAQELIEKAEFNEVIEDVEGLLKSDIELAFNTLRKLDDKLELLSVEQKLNYYRLLSEAYILKSQFITAKKTTGKALNLAKKLSSPSILMIELLYLRGFSFENLGDLKSAEDNYKKGLEIAESVHDKVLIASGLIELGAIAYLSDDNERSLILLNEGYKIANQTDDSEVKGKATSELAIVYGNIGQIEQAMIYNLQSYEHFKEVGMLLSAQNSLSNLGWDYNESKQYDKAIATFNKVILESKGESSRHIMYGVYSGLARSYFLREESNPELAHEYFIKAGEHLEGSQRYDNQLQFYVDQSFVLFQLKRYEEALASIDIAEDILAEHNLIPKVKNNIIYIITNLRSKSLYELKRFKEAYDIKSLLPSLLEKWYESVDVQSVAATRLSLESEQADLKNKLLKNENTVHEASLIEARKVNKEQQLYIIASAIVAIALAWLVIKLIYSQRQLKIASTIDSLTGIANRRSLMKKALLAFNSAKSKNTSLSLLMIDVDHFKEVNDTLGHNQGDLVLQEVVQLTSSLMRKSDVFGRWGGEEFMVFLPRQNKHAAIEVAERIRLCIAQKKWLLCEIEQITVSIGVASFDNDTDLVGLIQRADKLLYQAKETGRNKVCS